MESPYVNLVLCNIKPFLLNSLEIGEKPDSRRYILQTRIGEAAWNLSCHFPFLFDSFTYLLIDSRPRLAEAAIMQSPGFEHI
jgi:hypothetical protein